MDKRIIYTNTNGGVSVVSPAPDSGMTIEEIAAKDVPVGVASSVIDVSALPKDRVFRNAWRMSGVGHNANVTENLTAAKAIAHNVRRAHRDMLFAPLDVEATIPAKAAQAEAARQAVRDADAQRQIAVDAATSTDALRVILASLGVMP